MSFDELPKIQGTNNRGINKQEIDAINSQIIRYSDNRTTAKAELARLQKEIASKVARCSRLEQDIEYYNNQIGLLKDTIKKARKQ